jgi:hypothetical protein
MKNQAKIYDAVYTALVPLTPLLVDDQSGKHVEFYVRMGAGLFEMTVKSIDMPPPIVLNDTCHP